MANKYYDNYAAPKYIDLPITIIGSNSAGNSIYFAPLRLLVDLGFPKSHYPKKFMYQVDYVALTHEHSDHLNDATVEYLYLNCPWITFISNDRLFAIIQERLAKRGIKIADQSPRFLRTTDKATELTVVQTGASFSLFTYQTHHGPLINVAYDIQSHVDIGSVTKPHLLYCSDLDTVVPKDGVLGLPSDLAVQFDVMCLEANYNLDEVLDILEHDPGDAKAKGNLRHLSEQAAFNYVRQHLKPTGVFMPLHASSTFGTFLQERTAV